MRVLILGSQNPWRMEVAVQRAMERAGHQVALFDDRRSARLVGRRLTQWRALRLARTFRPDFVFLSKCLRLDVDTVAEIVRGVPSVLWYHDAPWFRESQRWDVSHIIQVGRLADVFFVSGFVEEWRAHGLNAEFLPSAASNAIVPVPIHPPWSCTVAFVGTGYDPTRAEFLQRVAGVAETRVYGPGWEPWRQTLTWNGGEIRGTDFARACSSARFTLGILPTLAEGATTYASDRMWMVMLAGGLYLGPWSPGIDTLLRNDEHCFWYRDLDDCLRRIRELESDPARCARVRETGEAFVRLHHTHDARVPFILEQKGWVNPLA